MQYRVSADWSLIVRYQSERFSNFDFRTTDLAPANGTHVFEGNNLLPYSAKFLTFLVSYRPGVIRRPRSTI